MSNEVNSYDDFCDRVGPIGLEWLDELDERQLERVLWMAWEGCAWVKTLTDKRIIVALEEAREKI